MRWFLLFLLAVVLALTPAPSKGGWGNVVCAPVGVPAPVVVTTEPPYWFVTRFPGQIDLVDNGRLVGSYNKNFDEYQPFLGTSYGSPCKPPIPLPDNFRAKPKPEVLVKKPTVKSPKCDTCTCLDECLCGQGKPLCQSNCRCVLGSGKVIEGAVVENDGTLNFGLGGPDQFARGKRILNGREVSKEELLEAVIGKGDRQLPDDAEQIFVTAIGDKAMTDKFLADVKSHPVLSKWKGKVRTNAFAPDDWQVKGMGFVPGSVYCQAPDGKVLHRQDGYDDPEKLALAIEKVAGGNREPNKDYDKSKDPDVTKPSLVPSQLKDVPAYVWVVCGVILYLLLTKKA